MPDQTSAKKKVMSGAPQVGDFEPLFPEDRVLGSLKELAHEVQKEAWKLAGFAHPSVLHALSPLLRSMNSYYTNLIEGQQTLPADIEKAMRKDFSPIPDRAAKQRLALAHMRTNSGQRRRMEISDLSRYSHRA
jgi:hypothetical protein